MGKNQHVVPADGRWGVKGERNSQFTSLHDTQAQAIEAGREIAIHQGSELFIHRPTGEIRERNTYGQDNFPPPG